MDGELTEEAKKQGIKIASALDMHMRELLQWALKEIEAAVKKT